MKDKELVAELSRRLGMTHKEVAEILSEGGPFIASLMNEETTVEINNFGTFEVKKKMERIVVNPSSKQRMLVPPKLVLNFKPSNTLKEKYK